MSEAERRTGRAATGGPLTFTSRLDRPAAVVWATVAHMRGVNAELRPIVAMTYPRAGGALRADNPRIASGFRSWLLLAGVIPIDRHSFHFEILEDGRFVECSHSWLNRRWRHERTVEPDTGTSTILRDELVVEPRLRIIAPLSRAAVRVVFEHRHRRLRRRFGSPPT